MHIRKHRLSVIRCIQIQSFFIISIAFRCMSVRYNRKIMKYLQKEPEFANNFPIVALNNPAGISRYNYVIASGDILMTK